MFSNLNPKFVVRLSLLLNVLLILYCWNLVVPNSFADLASNGNIQHFSGYGCELGCPQCNVSDPPKVQVTQKECVVSSAEPSTLSSGPVTSSAGSVTSSADAVLLQGTHPASQRTLSPSIKCSDKTLNFRQGMRGKYWVLYNYIRAKKRFSCNESITYTTHGDFAFMDNLEPLLKRWEGPASIAVYCPGEDYQKTVDTILYYRDCASSRLVKDLVTFHLIFPLEHIPADIVRHRLLNTMTGNCSATVDWGEGYKTYRKSKELDYPVNVARNVARETVQTHFVFPSDIELYPAPGTINGFLQMVRNEDGRGPAVKPRVFVNSIFEIQANATLPNTKSELVGLLKSGVVIPFHKHVCPSCHNVPNSKGWISSPAKSGMNVVHVGKRLRPFHHWEPIYIGTNQEPLYDERLSWEGRSDKMTQGFTMCVLDYEFHILDNAFLIHRPGIKTKKSLHLNNKKVAAQNTLIRKTIFSQIKKIYGTRKGCEMW